MNGLSTLDGDIRPVHLLLVEDELVILMSERRALVDRGYAVSSARTGEEAIRIAASDDSIDLLVSDLELGPGIDGIGAAKTIVGLRPIPVVFLTSCPPQELRKRAQGLGAYEYVNKREYGAALAEVIDRSLCEHYRQASGASPIEVFYDAS